MSANMYLDLGAAAERSGRSTVTLRRYIKTGRLPAVKDGRKIYVTEADLDSAVMPIPIVASDVDLKSWAQRLAATAPPFRQDQLDIIISAFTSSSRGA